MTPRKLTEAQQARCREIGALRRSIPTNAQLAAEMGCSQRLIARFTAGGQYRFRVERASKVHECLIELGLAKP